ncbi:MAG: hypothetical protein RLZZ196_1606 [Bacteroidota bacterium]|jgi:hypothetical protein
MYKFAFDRLDYMRDNPYPNLWDNNVIAQYHNNSKPYNFDTNTQEFVLHTCHSELYGNMIKNKNNHTIIREEYEHMQFYLYPIELFGDHRNLIKEERESKSGVKYNTAFIKNVSRQAIQMAKWEKLKFVVNYSHEPFSDIEFLNIFSEQIQSIGLREEHFIFFVGTSNLLELYPELQHRGFIFLFEDSIITSTARKIKDLKTNPNYTLGYETKWIDESEIDVKRNKHFVCLNRSSNKPHRYTLGCFFENKKMWEKVYASFLRPNENRHWMYETDDVDFDYEMAESSDEFAKKIPIEIDTQNSEDKESFEVAKAFKKEIYLDSYIYIVTETNFERDIFLTEKICNPIAVLQPFILFGACGYLKYLRSLGFKTFDGFIDETYDTIEDNKQRYLTLCAEIERISNLPLEEIHNWYLSIKDILIHNRNHLLSFADKVMFKENLDKLAKEWIEFQMQFEK